ncbi:MAG: TraB/GumN family protein [Fibrobacter sp.]|jgi:pheromone shutdown-related protein TraB|nr:TraB/GumN family protein [Fibrobacter sp.]
MDSENFEPHSDIFKIQTEDHREIILIGTAHISQESKDLVRETIEKEHPDTICVELDEGRLKSLSEPDRWKTMDLKTVIRQKQLGTLVANLVLGSYQKRMGEQTGVRPGAELAEAVTLAQKNHIPLVLADRDIKVTLRRTWSCTPWYRKLSLLGALFGSIFDKTEISEEELAKIKEQDTLSVMMEEFGKTFPEVKQVLINERDEFLAGRIMRADGKKIVAVVGAGHVQGIVKILSENQKLPNEEELCRIEKGSPVFKIIGWSIPLAIIASIVAIGFHSGMAKVGELTLQWALLTGGGAAFGTLLAGGHPLTILVAFLTAPFSALTPLIGVGFFTAFTQAYFRPPRVEEMENVSEDIWKPSRWWKNRMTRIFLCFLLPAFPAVIGQIFAIFEIYKAF